MVFSLVYLIVRWLLGLLVIIWRGDLSKDVELLVLRQEHCAAPPGPASPLRAGGPDLVRGAVPAPPSPPLVGGVPRDSRDDPALAPGSGRPTVDLHRPAPAGTATDRDGGQEG
jgi:hypothetical protein